MHAHITIATHSNLRAPDMLYDEKHIRKEKIPKFAANLIRALKSAYGISSKGELFQSNYREIPKQASTYQVQYESHRPYMNNSLHGM